MHPRLFQLGHLAIPTYGAFTALALLAGLAVFIYTAPRLQLNANKVWNLGLIAILTTLIAARLLLTIVYFSAFRQHPFWVLGLSEVHSQWVNTIALLVGFVAALLYAAAEGLPIARTLDCIAPAGSLAMALNRIGAFVAGLDYGVPALHAWGVTYSSRIAASWYHTPLGVALAPVQLYEAVSALVILLALLWWLPRRTQDGELWGAWLFLSGFAGFFLRGQHAAIQTGWVLPSSVTIAMVAASAPFLLRRQTYSKSYTGRDDSPRN